MCHNVGGGKVAKVSPTYVSLQSMQTDKEANTFMMRTNRA